MKWHSMAELSPVLVIAAHPDDETLGCGGTVAKLKSAGAHITILILGEGPTARQFPSKHQQGTGEDVIEEVIKRASVSSAIRSASILAIEDLRFASLPDNRFDTVSLLSIIKIIEEVKISLRPRLVLTHYQGDLNIDHQIAQRSVMTAFRSLPGEKPAVILGFEVLSSTEYPYMPGVGFIPNVYGDITSYVQLKQQALAAYGGEMRNWPHPRSMEAVEYLGKLRGCQAGVEFAEAFMLYRGDF